MSNLTAEAEAFRAKNPTHLATIAGVKFYEDPIEGDEETMTAILPDGRAIHTDWWDLPGFEEASDFVNRHREAPDFDPAEAFKTSDSLADLVRMAVHDARSLDVMSYTPGHADLHRPHLIAFRDDSKLCEVSFAGAVMAARLGVESHEKVLDTARFDDATKRRLDALASISKGRISAAYTELGQRERGSNAERRWHPNSGPFAEVAATSLYFEWDNFHPHLDALEDAAKALDAFESEHPIGEPEQTRSTAKRNRGTRPRA